MKILTLFLIGYLMLGCKHDIEQEILQLQSQIIALPTDAMLQQINGRDTTIDYISDKSMKLVVYSDSSVCSSCALKSMNEWDSFIQKVNKAQGKLQLFFIFSPRRREIIQVKNTVASNVLDYPVFIDTMKLFAKSNPHLPKNTRLHTFLLDEENKVILVGNQLINRKLIDLYNKMIEDKLSKM